MQCNNRKSCEHNTEILVFFLRISQQFVPISFCDSIGGKIISVVINKQYVNRNIRIRTLRKQTKFWPCILREIKPYGTIKSLALCIVSKHTIVMAHTNNECIFCFLSFIFDGPDLFDIHYRSNRSICADCCIVTVQSHHGAYDMFCIGQLSALLTSCHMKSQRCQKSDHQKNKKSSIEQFLSHGIHL